jgi:uncharacterized protein YkvS
MKKLIIIIIIFKNHRRKHIADVGNIIEFTL